MRQILCHLHVYARVGLGGGLGMRPSVANRTGSTDGDTTHSTFFNSLVVQAPAQCVNFRRPVDLLDAGHLGANDFSKPAPLETCLLHIRCSARSNLKSLQVRNEHGEENS